MKSMWILTDLSPIAWRGKLFTKPGEALRYLQGQYGPLNVTSNWQARVPKRGRSPEIPEHWVYWVKFKQEAFGKEWDGSQRYELYEIEVIA